MLRHHENAPACPLQPNRIRFYDSRSTTSLIRYKLTHEFAEEILLLNFDKITMRLRSVLVSAIQGNMTDSQPDGSV